MADVLARLQASRGHKRSGSSSKIGRGSGGGDDPPDRKKSKMKSSHEQGDDAEEARQLMRLVSFLAYANRKRAAEKERGVGESELGNLLDMKLRKDLKRGGDIDWRKPNPEKPYRIDYLIPLLVHTRRNSILMEGEDRCTSCRNNREEEESPAQRSAQEERSELEDHLIDRRVSPAQASFVSEYAPLDVIRRLQQIRSRSTAERQTNEEIANIFMKSAVRFLTRADAIEKHGYRRAIELGVIDRLESDVRESSSSDDDAGYESEFTGGGRDFMTEMMNQASPEPRASFKRAVASSSAARARAASSAQSSGSRRSVRQRSMTPGTHLGTLNLGDDDDDDEEPATPSTPPRLSSQMSLTSNRSSTRSQGVHITREEAIEVNSSPESSDVASDAEDAEEEEEDPSPASERMATTQASNGEESSEEESSSEESEDDDDDQILRSDARR